MCGKSQLKWNIFAKNGDGLLYVCCVCVCFWKKSLCRRKYASLTDLDKIKSD